MTCYCQLCGSEWPAEKNCRAHIQRSTKGQHEGVGYHEADSFIVSNDPSDESTEESDSYEREGQNAPTENQENPLMEEPDVENSQSNSNPDEGSNAGTISVECIECGNSNDVSSEVVRDRHFNCGRCGQLNKVPDGVEL